jgi:hypothetical protein
MITIYTLTYNEEVMIEFFIQHYRKKFPNCIINIYDNESTDNTIKIAKSYDCNIITYNTNNTLSDSVYLNIKNNCWKNATTDWVLICDCDELLEINQDNLLDEINNNTTIIQTEGFDMINVSDDPTNIVLTDIKHGVRNQLYDKKVLFNKTKINEINYQPGCHLATPIGGVINSKKIYKLLHYKYINLNYIINRYRLFNSRLSNENRIKKWGIQYTYEESTIIENFNELKSKSEKIYE